MEEEKLLDETISCFYKDKQELDSYKKSTDEYNKQIKELMAKLEIDNYVTDDGLNAKISIQKRESFIDDKLIAKLKELGMNNVIKTVEVVDMDELENAIYNNEIDVAELSDCKTVKEIVTLKVTAKKGK